MDDQHPRRDPQAPPPLAPLAALRPLQRRHASSPPPDAIDVEIPWREIDRALASARVHEEQDPQHPRGAMAP
jgi:hypothetical protein